jgi:RNA polymerase sigma factor (sigma-70 family)
MEKTNRLKLSEELDRAIAREGINELTKADLAKLHYDWQTHEDQEAYHKLYIYSMRLVYKIVNKLERLGMLGRERGLQGSSYEDAISNGAIGIAEGLEKWNPNLSSLTSYVWIAIRRNVLNGNTKDWNKGLVGDNRNSGGAPINYDPNKQWSNNMDSRGITVNEIDRAIVDPEADPVLEAAIHMELNDLVREKLTPVQQKVIKLLYMEDMTQAEAGLIIGRTQQRVDQIHREALEALRNIYL